MKLLTRLLQLSTALRHQDAGRRRKADASNTLVPTSLRDSRDRVAYELVLVRGPWLGTGPSHDVQPNVKRKGEVDGQ